MLEVVVLTPFNMLGLSAVAAGGDAKAAGLLRTLSAWLRNAAATGRGSAPLCLNCDAEFSGGVDPLAFAVAMPFAAAQGKAMVSGICVNCVERAVRGDGLMALAMRAWRKIWPDLHIAEGGHG